MTLIVMDPNRSIPFSLADDDPAQPPAVFSLLPSNGSRFLTLMDEYSAPGRNGASVLTFRSGQARDLVAMYLVGWSGILQEDGQPLPFPAQGAADWLDSLTIVRIATEILNRAQLGIPTVGNSGLGLGSLRVPSSPTPAPTNAGAGSQPQPSRHPVPIATGERGTGPAAGAQEVAPGSHGSAPSG